MKQIIIKQVAVIDGYVVSIKCNNNKTYKIDLSDLIQSNKVISKIKKEFATASVGLWGHSVQWSCGVDMGVDRLISIASEQKGESVPLEIFQAWRERNHLTYDKAAAAIGISRRMVGYYESGEKPIPKYIGLACVGWENIHCFPPSEI